VPQVPPYGYNNNIISNLTLFLVGTCRVFGCRCMRTRPFSLPTAVFRRRRGEMDSRRATQISGPARPTITDLAASRRITQPRDRRSARSYAALRSRPWYRLHGTRLFYHDHKYFRANQNRLVRRVNNH